jgi:hypothetical protein
MLSKLQSVPTFGISEFWSIRLRIAKGLLEPAFLINPAWFLHFACPPETPRREYFNIGAWVCSTARGSGIAAEVG